MPLSTGTRLTDPSLVAEYLEETYPYMQSVFHLGLGLFRVLSYFIWAVTWSYTTLPFSPSLWSHSTGSCYRRTKELALGRTLEEMDPLGAAAQGRWNAWRRLIPKDLLSWRIRSLGLISSFQATIWCSLRPYRCMGLLNVKLENLIQGRHTLGVLFDRSKLVVPYTEIRRAFQLRSIDSDYDCRRH